MISIKNALYSFVVSGTLGPMVFWMLITPTLLFTVKGEDFSDWYAYLLPCAIFGWAFSTRYAERKSELAGKEGDKALAIRNIAGFFGYQWLTGYIWIFLPLAILCFLVILDIRPAGEYARIALLVWLAGAPLAIRYALFSPDADDRAAEAAGGSLLGRLLARQWLVILAQSILLPLAFLIWIKLGDGRASVALLLFWLILMPDIYRQFVEDCCFNSDEYKNPEYWFQDNSVLMSKFYVGMLCGVVAPFFVYDIYGSDPDQDFETLIGASWYLGLIGLLFIYMEQRYRRSSRLSDAKRSMREDVGAAFEKADGISKYPSHFSGYARCGIAIDARERKIGLLDSNYGGPGIYGFEDVVSAGLERSKRTFRATRRDKLTRAVYVLRLGVIDFSNPSYEIVFDENEAGEAKDWRDRINAILELRRRSLCQCAPADQV